MKNKQEVIFINVRDTVIFPKMSQGLFIGRAKSIEAIREALKTTKKILILSQRSSEQKMPKSIRDMYSIGTTCSIDGSVMMQDGTMKVVLTGESVFTVESIIEKDGIQLAKGKIIKENANKTVLNESERLSLLELLIRSKPAAALDEDASWFEELRNEKKSGAIFNLLQSNLNYCRNFNVKFKSFKLKPVKKEVLSTNLRVRLQQKILETQKSNQKISAIKDYLKFELKNAVEKLEV